MDTRLDSRPLIAEAIGTFVFLTIAFFGVVGTLAMGAPDVVVISFGFGLGLFAAIHIAGAISGGHFNPAVTLAAVIDRRMEPVTGVAYVVAQLVGGIVAGLFVWAVVDRDAVASTVNAPGAGLNDVQAILVEVVFTAIFVAVILTVTRRAAQHAAFAIPLTLAVIHLATVPFTGTSVNPVRSLAPALVGGELGDVWIFILGPLVGAVLGWAAYLLLSREDVEMEAPSA